MIESTLKFGNFKSKIKADGESERTVAIVLAFGAAAAVAIGSLAAIAAVQNGSFSATALPK